MRRPITRYCLSLQRTDERRPTSAYEWHHKVAFILGEGDKQQSQAVSLGIYPDTFPPPSRCRICAFFPSDAGNTAEGNCCSRYQSKPLCLEDTGPAWLPGPFMETVLGLIIPSCASSPSPAGLCVLVSSESAPHSHRSQGETRGEVCTHTGPAQQHTEHAYEHRQCNHVPTSVVWQFNLI